MVFLFLMLNSSGCRQGNATFIAITRPLPVIGHEYTWSTSYWTEASCPSEGKEVKPGISSSHCSHPPWMGNPKGTASSALGYSSTQGWAGKLTFTKLIKHTTVLSVWSPEMLPGTHAPHMPLTCSGPLTAVGSGSNCWMGMVRGG